MDLFTNGINFEALLDILRRRWWIGVALFSLIMTATFCLLKFLPNIYTATAYIVVEGQQVPVDYVRSTVTTGVERRLHAISQEILSRARLEKLVEQFNLYEDLKAEEGSQEVILKAMRRDVGVQFGGRDTVSFSVSYTSPEREKVALVVNTLASWYIEENLKVRERQALGTSDFLRSQLEEVKQQLEIQERRVVQYKQQNMGELPEQLNANLGALSGLQKQLEIASTNLTQAKQRRSLIVQQLTDANAEPVDIFSADPKAVGIVALKQKLGELQLRFSDKHPDVILLKQMIASLQQTTEGAGTQQGNVGLSPVEAELAAVDAEIRQLAAEVSQLQTDIAFYQQRIEITPRREQELTEISRDYTNTRELYSSLLRRLQEAGLADSLEQNQKAERFRLVESATTPEIPSGPKRMGFLILGFLLGLGAAVGAMIGLEFLDSSFHRLEDLRKFTTAPVLGSIPQIVTSTDRWRKRFRQGVGAVALAALMILLAGASYWVATENEQLVRLLYKPPSGVILR